MSRNYSRAAADAVRKRRRRNSLLVSALAVVIIITLLLTEQIALLYLICTFGVVALLLVVAFSDLQGAKETTGIPAPADDSAAIADGIAGTPAAAVANTLGSAAARRPRRRAKR